MVGTSGPRFFTSGRDIWAEIGRGKVGLSGNILVKSNFTKSKFDNVFDIREVYSQNIKNMRKICLPGFSIQRLWRISCGKFLETFLLVHYFQNKIVGCL